MGRFMGLVVLLAGFMVGCVPPQSGLEAVSHRVVFDNFNLDRMADLDDRMRTLPGFISLRSDFGGMSTAHHHEYILRARADSQRVKRHIVESLGALSLKGLVSVGGGQIFVKGVTMAKDRGRRPVVAPKWMHGGEEMDEGPGKSRGRGKAKGWDKEKSKGKDKKKSKGKHKKSEW